MWSKKYRLNSKEIKEVFSQGKRINLEKIILFIFRAKEGAKNPKISVVISSKVYPSAVKRNKIKRVVIEIIRKNFLSLFPVNLRMILMIKYSLSQMNNKEIVDYLQEAFTRLKII